jgi:hypothetical protein
MLAEGAVVGYSSALFGLAEPYTVTCEEQTTMLMISTEDRPLSLWPRDIVMRFHELLKARTDWHSQRAGQVAGARNGAFDVGKGRPLWTTANSTFLRHKSLDPQQTRAIRKSVEVDDGWTRVPPPKGRGGLDRKAFGARSAPPLGTQASSPTGLPKLWPTRTPQLTGSTTPWGSWLPSGALSLASTRRPNEVLPKLSHGTSSAKTSTQPDERPALDLMRPGDWRGLSSVASGTSAEKMYWRQVRMMSTTAR